VKEKSNGMDYGKSEKEPAIPLPIDYFHDKRRQRILELYAAKLSHQKTTRQIIDVLESMYEEVYSRGIADGDKMHST
jgi:hypothetical protein